VFVHFVALESAAFAMGLRFLMDTKISIERMAATTAIAVEYQPTFQGVPA
jgi:hypothetical protein